MPSPGIESGRQVPYPPEVAEKGPADHLRGTSLGGRSGRLLLQWWPHPSSKAHYRRRGRPHRGIQIRIYIRIYPYSGPYIVRITVVVGDPIDVRLTLTVLTLTLLPH